MNNIAGSTKFLFDSLIALFLVGLIYVFVVGFLMNGSVQSLAYFTFYLSMFSFLYALSSKGMHDSLIFLAFSVYILITFPQSFLLYSSGIEFHRDMRFYGGFDIDLAVTKKYLNQFFYFFTAFLFYAMTPKRMVFFNEKKFKINSNFNFKVILYFIFSLFFLVLFLYINQAGGISSALTQRSLVNYERAASQGGGHYIVFLKFSFVISIVWMLVDNKATSNIWFWLSLIFTIFISGLLTGSRSTVVFNFMIFMTTYVLVYKKIPLKYIVPIILVVAIFIGYLTANRFVSNETIGQLNLTEVISSSYDGISSVVEESSARAGYIDTSIGVYGLVPHAYNYAYGATYKAIPFIPIPSMILPFEKPEAAGKSYTFMLVNHTDTGWPPGTVAEAYWNFSYYGVFIAGMVLGIFYKIANNTYIRNQGAPISCLLFLSTIFFFELGSDTLFKFLQFLAVSIFIYISIRKLAMRS